MAGGPGTAVDGRDLMRRRVERSLEDSLASLVLALRNGSRTPPRTTLEGFEEKVLAFSAVGVLCEGEAAAWRERFAGAVEAVRAPDDAVVTPEVRARAGELVEAHLAKLESAEAKDVGAAESLRFHATLSALADLPAISRAQSERWRERRESALGRRRPPPPPAPPLHARAELRRVVAAPPRRSSGVRLICAELWDDRVVLRWHRVMSADEVATAERRRLRGEAGDSWEEWRRAADAFELRDDVETRYEAQMLGSGEVGPDVRVILALAMASEPQPVCGQAIFLPPVPREATRLEAFGGGDRFRLELA